ncbi:MAG: amidohydrolase [Chloroflexota bacterium]
MAGKDRVGEIKKLVSREVDRQASGLRRLALEIHRNPEVAFKEKKAAALLTGYLEKRGFQVERGICRLPTAFRAVYGQGRPRLAILCEYDALPEVGHGCGHNLIAGLGAGAGVAAKLAVDRFGGTLEVIGTPAEELGAGKAIMVDRGAFNGIEAALMAHPELQDIAASNARALQMLDVVYIGRESHAGARPETGVNALEALLLAFNNINSLRHRLVNQGMVQGIITDGGKAANIVPGRAAGQFAIRASTTQELGPLKKKVLACFRAAAVASGCRLQYKWGVRLDSVVSNLVLAGLYARNMESLGRKVVTGAPRQSNASSDLGNVSQITPTIQPLFAIAPVDCGIRGHSREWAELAASRQALSAMIDAAKSLAMTVVDLLANPANLAAAKKEFKSTIELARERQ